MNKYILAIVPLSLSILTYAHEPYVAPLSYITSNTQIPVISAYAEQAFQAEHAIENINFNVIQPDQTQHTVNVENQLKSASVFDLKLPQSGTYIISTKTSFPLKYVQHNKEWKMIFDVPADEAGNLNDREYVVPSDFEETPAPIEITREWTLQSFVSKEQTSKIKTQFSAPIQVKFAQHPNQIKTQQPVQIFITKFGKALQNAELLVRLEGQTDTQAQHIPVNTDGMATLNFPYSGQYLVEVSEKINPTLKPTNQYYTIISLGILSSTLSK